MPLVNIFKNGFGLLQNLLELVEQGQLFLNRRCLMHPLGYGEKLILQLVEFLQWHAPNLVT